MKCCSRIACILAAIRLPSNTAIGLRPRYPSSSHKLPLTGCFTMGHHGHHGHHATDAPDIFGSDTRERPLVMEDGVAPISAGMALGKGKMKFHVRA